MKIQIVLFWQMATWEWANSICVSELVVQSGLQSFLRRVTSCDLVYHVEGTEDRTQSYKVPSGTVDRCSEPGRAEAEKQADAAQQVRQHPSGSVILFEFSQGPAFGQRVVEEGQRCQWLQECHPHRPHAKDTMPGGQMRFAVQMLVVIDGHYTQKGTRDAETLQDPVKLSFRPVCKRLDGGAIRGENEYGFWHEEGKLMGCKRRQNEGHHHYWYGGLVEGGGKKSFDLQLASSKKGARKTNLKQDKSNLFYSKTDKDTEQNWSSRKTHLNLDDSEA